MEMSLNPMEKLGLLEKKILSLIENLKSQKELNAKLEMKIAELSLQLEQLEMSILQGNRNIDELNQEKALTKMVVEELITSINKMVEQEQQ